MALSGARIVNHTSSRKATILALVVALSITIALGLAFQFCRPLPWGTHYLSLGFYADERPWKCDAYFTWRAPVLGHRGIPAEGKDVMYVWNGIEVGAGPAGFEKILSSIRALPRGSKVKVFPNYGALYAIGLRSREYPFEAHFGTLRRIAVTHNLTIIFSVTDERGHLHGAIRRILELESPDFLRLHCQKFLK